MNNKPHQPGKVFVAEEENMIGDLKNKFRRADLDNQLKAKFSVSEILGAISLAYYRGKQSTSPLPASFSIEKDPFIEKHLAIIKQKTKDLLIDEHIGKMWGDLSSASIKYFLETGKINGGFREHLCNLMDAWKKYKLDEPASSSIEGQKEEWISIGDYEKLALKKLSDKPVIKMLLNDKKCGSFKDWPSNIHRMIDEAMGATRETRVKLSAPTISKEDERVTRNRNTIYTYYQVEFNYCSAFDGDYMICESIDQITDLLKQVDINLDDPEVKATVEIKGIPMTPAEYETWLKENDTSF